MSGKKKTDQTEAFGTSLTIAGKPATQQELSRVMQAPTPAGDPNERATKPIQTLSRPFGLMR